MKSLKANLPTLILLLLEAAVGVLLLVNPIGFTSAIIRIIGCVMAVGGVVLGVNYFRTPAKEAAASGMLFSGLIFLLIGVLLFVKTNWLIATFTILLMVYAVMILILGLLKFQWTIDLIRMKREKWGIAGVNALIAVIFGLLILLNPFKSTEVLWKLAGAALLAQAFFDIVGLFLCPRVVVVEMPQPKTTEKSRVGREEQPDAESGSDR